MYAFLRRSGRGIEDAQDLTQDFFARLLDGSLLSSADPAKGKFRTLLLAALKNLDANAWKAARTQKRGGGAEVVPLDSVLFTLLAFYGSMSWNMIFQIIFADIVVKYLIAAALAVRGRHHEDTVTKTA